ncbi:MAG: hypothetical protein ACTSU5_15950, partial [Promethearchaeota archaeon]
MGTSGVPIVIYDLAERTRVVDATLVSGFLTALQNFGAELFQVDSSSLVVEYGSDKITSVRWGDLILAYISGEAVPEKAEELRRLLDWVKPKVPSDGHVLDDPVTIEALRVKLLRILHPLPIASDWIPVPDREWEAFRAKHPESACLNACDGVKNIAEVARAAGCRLEEAYELMNAAFRDSALRFDNFIEPRDYVLGTPRLAELLEQGGEGCREAATLAKKLPREALVKMVQELEEFQLVQELVDEFGEDTIPLLEAMFHEGCLSLVDEDSRKLLMAIDMSIVILNLLKRLVKADALASAFRDALASLDKTQVERRVEFRG